MEYKAFVNQLRFNFPLTNCRVGEKYEARLTFEVIEMSKRGATVEILNLETETGNNAKTISQPVPSPS